MYGLSVGISNVSETLPRAVYALLSGLNAATVGIIVLAAVELSAKAITDQMTRSLVFLAGAAGLLYNAVWYFPTLMLAAGFATVVHDHRWLHKPVGRAREVIMRKKKTTQENRIELGEGEMVSSVRASLEVASRTRSHESGRPLPDAQSAPSPPPEREDDAPATTTQGEPRVIPSERKLQFSWKVGVLIITLFLLSFIIIMVLRGVLPGQPPLLYRLFANMYLAGTIIFGGGPVVIPLLREYVVAEGWVNPRDFLIGLAIIQALPGPNFNFAVYLGSLTASNAGFSSVGGALIAYIGIFLPGMWMVHGTVGVWSRVRGLRSVKSFLRGVNAGAVGLIYTAVYRLWQIGYIDEGYRNGTSLATEPWWVVVTATSFVGGMWFGVKPPVAIVMGAVMGLIWYGVVSD